MKTLARKSAIVMAGLLALLGTAAYMHRSGPQGDSSMDTLLLLIPDSANADDPQIHQWLDAAEEEGLHLQIVRDSFLLSPMFKFHAAGLIVPDQVHRLANDTLIGALHEYVESGGKLMLVYDACTLDLNGYFPRYESRLSDLIGVNYALYDQYKKNTMEFDKIWGSQKTMQDLEILPGKYIPLASDDEEPGWLQQVAWSSPQTGDTGKKFTLARYLYNDLKYPSFHTSGNFDGHVLLSSRAGVVAGTKKHGAGKVLFVNLPLGYLKSRTDGLLLHSFLLYFATHVLHLPHMASVPDGIGGLVLNWHIDAASALKPLAVMQKAGIFDQSPFSVHFTAGPDVNSLHDGKGLDVEHNPEAQGWIQYFQKHGDVVGSHGGWIHNYFGEQLSDSNQREMEPYIVHNNQALEHVTGQHITEYSAPLGNHPEWTTNWLEQHGFVAYYFAGDTGMGPTMVYRDSGKNGSSIWGFPMAHLGTEASLEEMNFDNVPGPIVQSWLLGIADFSAHNHVARLVYSHPVGATRYIPALQEWLQHTQKLSDQREFRWYTMTALATFLNSRRQVQWTLGRSQDKLLLQASHPKSLYHQTWLLPKQQYRNLRVVQGSADIQDKGDFWLVAANDCQRLAVEMGEEM